jgi:hypothetical protein
MHILRYTTLTVFIHLTSKMPMDPSSVYTRRLACIICWFIIIRCIYFFFTVFHSVVLFHRAYCIHVSVCNNNNNKGCLIIRWTRYLSTAVKKNEINWRLPQRVGLIKHGTGIYLLIRNIHTRVVRLGP